MALCARTKSACEQDIYLSVSMMTVYTKDQEILTYILSVLFLSFQNSLLFTPISTTNKPVLT